MRTYLHGGMMLLRIAMMLCVVLVVGACTSYGVKQELRDTRVPLNGREQSLLDAIGLISFGGCGKSLPPWLAAAQKRDDNISNLSLIVQPDAACENKAAHRCAQFVDGGVNDNLGLRAMLDAIELVSGARQYQQDTGIATPRRLAVISVNTSADTPQGIGASNRAATIEETLNAVANIQLHRYHVATVRRTQQGLERWAREFSTPERPVASYFIRLSFEDVPEGPLRRYLDEIPTSFELGADQVDSLVATGRELLRNNADFQRLPASLRGQIVLSATKSATPCPIPRRHQALPVSDSRLPDT